MRYWASVQNLCNEACGQMSYSKVVRRRTSVGRTQAGDVLIVSKARECSYSKVLNVHVLILATAVLIFHSEKNAAKDLNLKQFPSHSRTETTNLSMFFFSELKSMFLFRQNRRLKILIFQWNSRLMFFGVRLYCSSHEIATQPVILWIELGPGSSSKNGFH